MTPSGRWVEEGLYFINAHDCEGQNLYYWKGTAWGCEHAALSFKTRAECETALLDVPRDRKVSVRLHGWCTFGVPVQELQAGRTSIVVELKEPFIEFLPWASGRWVEDPASQKN